MNKSTLFVIYISIASSIGFIGGMYFNVFYNRDLTVEHNKDIAVELVTELKEVRKLFESYENIIINDRVVNDLYTIKSLNDIDSIINKYKEFGLSSIELFKEQANSLKDNSENFSAIIEFEKRVEEFEKNFKHEQPLAVSSTPLRKGDS